MSNPLSVDIKDILVANGIGVCADSGDWGIFISVIPDVPDNCIAVFDVPSSVEGRVLQTGEVLDKLAFSIRIRSIEYLAGWDKVSEINAVMDALNGFSGIDRDYRTVKRLQNATPEGRDESKRFQFTIDYVVTIDN